MKTHLIFPTPIAQDSIKSDLEQYVMNLSRTDDGVKLSNRGGYQSNHFHKPEKEFQDLWEQIEVKVNDFPLFSADIGISGSKVAVKLEETILRGEN